MHVEIPTLNLKGEVHVGGLCGDMYIYRPTEKKFFVLGMTEFSCYDRPIEETEEMRAAVTTYEEGTYFDATSLDRRDWHFKYKGVRRARSMGNWLDEEVS